MRAKAATPIHLRNGDTMTVKEALTAGRVEKVSFSSERWNANNKLVTTTRYYIREVGTDNLWDIGETFFRGAFEDAREEQQ